MRNELVRLRKEHEAAGGPPRGLYHSGLATAAQVSHLETLVTVAMRFAAILHEEDPSIVWGQLARMPEREVRELCVIALAAIPVNMTQRQLLGWVERMGER